MNPLTGKYVTIATRDGLTINQVGVTAEDKQSVQDDQYDYEFGLVNYTISGLDVGETVEVQIFFESSQQASGFTARKFINSSYVTLAGAAVENVQAGNSPAVKLTFGITDGGEHDADGQANGVIVDPVGLGSVQGSLASTGSDTIVVAMFALAVLVGGAGIFVMTRRNSSTPRD